LFGIVLSTLSAQPPASVPLLGTNVTAGGRRGQGDNDSSADDGMSSNVPGASYSRFSSAMQREEGITDQQRGCRELARKNGHSIASDFEFADEAVSGTKLHRAGLDAMLAAAEAGKFSVLYFFSLSRLARESVITMPMLKTLVHVYKVRVISVTEGIDSDRDGWELMATIFSLLHERYIKDLSANVFRGQEGTVLAGFSVGDHCFGFASAPIPGSEVGRRGRHAKPRMTYIIDEKTAPWVIRIFHWFTVEKRSTRGIARELNRLHAPKDHRATTPHWHHQMVTALLRNEKYVGIWPRGRKKNVRRPHTGQVSQESRPEEECAAWTRYLPHLRLIPDETMAAAKARLDENAARNENRRQTNGRLRGSRTGNATEHPRHLLSRLLRCEACGAVFYVGGANGRYLFCPNYAKGLCTCQTQVPRALAEKVILAAIGQRILSNPTWREAVLIATQQAWTKSQRQRPDEIETTEKALADVKRKIGRLLDGIEIGTDGPEVRARLAERQREKQELEKRLTRLQAAEGNALPEPTAERVDSKFKDLGEIMAGGGPAAALALRALVGGKILIREIREPDRRRFYTQGRFTIHSTTLQDSLNLQAKDPEPGSSCTTLSEEIVLDFREPDPAEMIVDEVKTLWDAGLTYREIATRVGWNRNIVAKAVAIWHRRQDLEPPDGRSCKKRLARPKLAEQLADKAKELWDQELLMQEIATRLCCNLDTATAAIAHWFRSRGLEVPDGRTRRKSLPRKSSTEREHQGPEDEGDVRNVG
jgi:site-specific DNA recombinase